MELATESMPLRAPRPPATEAVGNPWGEFLQRFLVSVRAEGAGRGSPASMDTTAEPGDEEPLSGR